MPINEKELVREGQGLLVLDAADTVGEAAEALRKHGGADWWTLIVRHGPEAFTKGTFADLRRALEQDPKALSRPLAEIETFVRVEAVQQDSMSTDAAWERAYGTSAEALVVLKGSTFLGLLTETTRAAADAFASISLLDMVEQVTKSGAQKNN